MPTYDQRGQQVNTQINIASIAASGGCPKCNQIDRVEKVSTIFSSGVTNAIFSVPSTASSNYATMSGGSQSLLSSKLAPPAKPSAEEMSGCAIFGGLGLIAWGGILTFIVLVVAADEGGIGGEFVPLLIFGLGLIGGGIAILVSSNNKAKLRKAKADSQMPDWERAIACWNRLYYCARDDGVFDPEERVFVPIEQMMDYIYR